MDFVVVFFVGIYFLAGGECTGSEETLGLFRFAVVSNSNYTLGTMEPINEYLNFKCGGGGDNYFKFEFRFVFKTVLTLLDGICICFTYLGVFHDINRGSISRMKNVMLYIFLFIYSVHKVTSKF